MLNEQVIADNRALIARNRDLERELARLKAKLGAVGRITDGCEERARGISDAAGELAVGTDLGRMRAYFHVGRELMEVMR